MHRVQLIFQLIKKENISATPEKSLLGQLQFG